MVQAHEQTVFINGLPWAVRGNIIVNKYPAWADAIRTVGNPQRSDRINASQWIQEDWSSGLGYFTQIGVHGSQCELNPSICHPSHKGFFSSTLETRWNGQVTLPGLIQATSITNNHSYYRFFIGWEQELLVMSNTAGQSIGKFNTSTTNWDQDESLSGDAWRPRFAFEHNEALYLFGGTSESNAIMKNTGSWADFNPSSNLSAAPHSGVVFKSIMYVATYTDPIVQIEKSINDGDDWTQPSGLKLTESGRSYVELINYRDGDGQPVPILITDSGMWLVDVIHDELLPIHKFGRRSALTLPDQFGRPTTWDDGSGEKLYIPRGRSLIEWHWSGAWRDISPLIWGAVPNLLKRAQSAISCLAVTEQWLFVGIAGITEISVWAYDGTGFHYIWGKSAPGTSQALRDIVIWDNEGNDTLFALYATGGTPGQVIEMVANVLENPLETTSFKFATTGNIETPHFDGGMSEVESVLLASGMSFADLDTTSNDNEKIKVETEFDYSGSFDSTSNRIVTFYSDTDPVTQKYVSGAGIQCRTWRHRYTLTRGSTNTKSPVMFYPTSSYRKKLEGLHQYRFQIDLYKSAELQGQFESAGDVIQNWKTITDSIPLVKFEWTGAAEFAGGGTRYVETVDPMLAITAQTDVESATPVVTEGIVDAFLREII